MAGYNTANLDRAKAGKVAEQSDNEQFAAGLYQHPEATNEDGTPVEIATFFDPLFGDVQSQAVARVGFKRVGDVPEGYVKHQVADFTKPKYNANDGVADNETLKGIQARLTQLESENAELRAKNETADEDAKDEDETPAPKALDKQNSTELAATAEAEGVDLTSATTNKEKAALIQKARDEAEKEGE